MQKTELPQTHDQSTPLSRRIALVHSPTLLLLLTVVSFVVAGENENEIGSPRAKSKPFISDSWELIEVSGAAAGYGRIREHAIERDGLRLHQIESVMRMRMRRLGQPVEAAITIQSTFDARGRMVDFRTETNLGGQAIISTGQFRGKRLEITTDQGGTVTTDLIDWNEETHGFFYEQRLLEKNPMRSGEQRTFASLLPIFNRVARTTLIAGDWSQTEVLGASKELLPITSRTMLAGQQLSATIWMDRDGQIVKTEEPTLGQTVTRTTREKALAGKRAAPPDLITETVIPLKSGSQELVEATHAKYLVRTARPLTTAPFPSSSCQACTATDDAHVWNLRVTADGNSEPLRENLADLPTALDRKPNRFIDQNDVAIRRLASQVGLVDGQEALAKQLTREVYRWITRKDFSTVLATATEVARTRSGDCTEHAVLLAAVARARGLPARVVVGLVYVPSLGGFAYHMWNQIWCDEAWRFFDATRSDVKCGAGHIKVTDDALSDENGLAVFLPVLQVMGGTEISLISSSD